MTENTFTAPRWSQPLALALIVLGAGSTIYGLSSEPGRVWPSLLLNGFYITSLSLSALFFLAIQRVTGARWSASLRRVPEALMLALPVAAVLMLALFFGRQTLFPWSHPGAFDHVPAIGGKAQYLQVRWVFARTAVALLLWVSFALLYRRTSLLQDRRPELSLTLHERLTRYAVLFIPVFAVTFTLSVFDWLISLEPEWFSTMFAVYVFAGTFVQGIAAVTLVVVLLKQYSPMVHAITGDQLHDLGKMLFAFSTFWAYIWVGQYLLIWYGNIPEEITHFVTRTNGPWLYLFALNLIVNWVVPFVVLLSARAKRSARTLIGISLLLLAAHWLDLYLLIMPTFRGTPGFGLLDFTIAAGYLALLYLICVRALARAPLVPLNDLVLNYEELRDQSQAFSRGLWGAKR